jgi:hypothetical protein
MEHIFDIWPSLAALAKDMGSPYQTVVAWKRRGRIPADRDLDLIEAARRRGALVTLEEMAKSRRLPRAPETERDAE